MNLQLAQAHHARVEDFQRRHRIGLVTLLFSDIVGSTQLKQQLGEREGIALILHHHALVRQTLAQFKEAEEISFFGDAFFLVFDKPSDAVKFSLILNTKLRALGQDTGHGLSVRIGIHVGKVFIDEPEGSAQPKNLYGIQVDTCARLMSLGEANQILMTRFAFDDARQVLTGRDLEGLKELKWVTHGAYLFKGIEETLEICEVGEVGEARTAPPASTEKAQRYLSADSDLVLGWRPALEQKVPDTRWILKEKLGEGGFGEVWLGRHEASREPRVFKFCFRADRVSALKREATLFRLLKERMGENPNIVRLLDLNFDAPPFYIEMEYVEGKDLATWAREQGGIDRVPLETQLEIAAQVADALQAAHDAGVIHRDVKPSNILVSDGRFAISDFSETNLKSRIQDLKLVAKLTDFGISHVMAEEYLAGMPRAGFTQTVATPAAAQAGTQIYMAPERLAGHPASTRSDIFSLGVVLYQMLVGDFQRPLTTDWAEQVADPLLREDLKHCFAGNAQERFAGVGQLAKNLRALPQRRLALAAQQAELAARERAAYRRGIIRAASLATVIVMVVTGLGLWAINQSRFAKREADRAEGQRQRAETSEAIARRNRYIADMNVAQADWENNNLARLRRELAENWEYRARGFEWYYWQRLCHLDRMTLWGHAEGITSVAFSPASRRILTGSHDRTVKLWDIDTKLAIRSFEGHKGGIMAVTFSPDGKRIATSSHDTTVKVWDTANGSNLFTLKGHKAWVSSVAFSPDGRRLATASGDATAKLWDATTGNVVVTLQHGDRLLSVSFSPDSARLATGSFDATAKIWDVLTGGQLVTLSGHIKEVLSVAFSPPDGKFLVTGSADQTAKVWDTVTGKEVFPLTGHSRPITSAAFSADGKRLITCGGDRLAKIWDAIDGRELLTLKGHTDGLSSGAFSPDGTQVITGSEDATAKLWDLASVYETLTLKGHTDAINWVVFSPDSKHLLSGAQDLTARIWDTDTGQEIQTVGAHPDAVLTAAYLPEGKRIATGGKDGSVRVLDLATGSVMLTLTGHLDRIRAAAFSPDGKTILTGSPDYMTKLWNASTGNEIRRLKGLEGHAFSVAFSRDSKLIVTGDNNDKANVWNAASGEKLLTLKGHKNSVNSVAFAPDGRRVLTGSKDATAKVWDAANGKELLSLKGHSGAINAAAFSPDGTRIVTGSDDLTAKIWDASSGYEMLTFKGHTQPVSSVAFAADGRRIATASKDGTIKVWEAASLAQANAWFAEEQATQAALLAAGDARADAEQRALTALAGDAGAIKRWLILAPIPFSPGQSSFDALDAEQIQSEANLKPKPGDEVTIDNLKLTWQPFHNLDYVINFITFVGHRREHCVAYAVCYILAEEELKALKLEMGSDDQAKLYLNGKELFAWNMQRNFLKDQDTIENVTLNKGVNVLVFKVVNENQNWIGSVRFTDKDGNPVKKIRVTLTP